MEQKGMTFDHDFFYFIFLFSSLLKKEGREKENEVPKIVIKSHTFLFHPYTPYCFSIVESLLSSLSVCLFVCMSVCERFGN